MRLCREGLQLLVQRISADFFTNLAKRIIATESLVDRSTCAVWAEGVAGRGGRKAWSEDVVGRIQESPGKKIKSETTTLVGSEVNLAAPYRVRMGIKSL